MTALKPGDTFPGDVVFKYVLIAGNRTRPSLIGLDRYIPWTEESADITSCGIPINYNASEEWANKKVVLFSVPGGFRHR